MTPNLPQISVGFATETGPRLANEDYVGISTGSARQRASHGLVAAVADGVSGCKGGRIAAETTVRQFIEGYYGQRETIGVQHAASRAIDAVNRWLYALGRRDPALESPMTTFTALILRRRQVHVLHVGDSRAYRLSETRLTRLTEDHTVNQRDMSHVLYRAVGIEDAVRLDYAVHPLQPFDRFLLCSDGVHGVLGADRLTSLLLLRASPEQAARNIVEAALEAGSTDNVSAVVLDVTALPAAGHAELEQTLADLPMLALPKPGSVVDGFRLGEPLSDGHCNALFRATDTTDGRSVVLKVPQPEVAQAETYRRAFLREAWVAARVRSPWLGEVIELTPGRQTRLYSVMPFYDGETLEARLTRQPQVTLAEGVDIALKLAKAVTALHRAGIIHRDIKPDNVLLLPGGGLKLIDLGVVRLPQIEKVETAGADEVNQEVEIPGTPSYMAPELFAGEPGNPLSDQFALGVTLYRVFTGAYPYGEIEPFTHPRFSKPTPLATRRRDLPAWLDAALARTLAINPKDRFGDVIEFALDLENGLARGGTMVIRRIPLYHRNPVRFWQIVSALLALILIGTRVCGR